MQHVSHYRTALPMNIFSTEILSANAAALIRPVLAPQTDAITLGMADPVPDKLLTLA